MNDVLSCFGCKWSKDNGGPDMSQCRCTGCVRMSNYEPARNVMVDNETGYCGPCYAGPPVSEVDLRDTIGEAIAHKLDREIMEEQRMDRSFRIDRGAPPVDYDKMPYDVKGTVLDQEEPYTANGYPNPLAIHDQLCQEGRRIMMKKNHDYTGGSGDPYANFRGSTALGIPNIQGILLRVQDKMMRIKTFEEKGQLVVKGEGIIDALVDVINYMVLIGGLVKEIQDAQEKECKCACDVAKCEVSD